MEHAGTSMGYIGFTRTTNALTGSYSTSPLSGDVNFGTCTMSGVDITIVSDHGTSDGELDGDAITFTSGPLNGYKFSAEDWAVSGHFMQRLTTWPWTRFNSVGVSVTGDRHTATVTIPDPNNSTTNNVDWDNDDVWVTTAPRYSGTLRRWIFVALSIRSVEL